jgi:hypothetical protein
MNMMRNLFRIPPAAIVTSITLFCAASISSIGADQGEVIRLSEPVAVTDEYEFYGATLPESDSPISLGELIGNSDKYQDQEVMVETRIAKVCQKKGCFFVATEGASSARITFKDYSFFIPTDSGGKTVTLVGVFSRQPISKEQAEHFAADLGETEAPATSDFEYSIVASAVRLPAG